MGSAITTGIDSHPYKSIERIALALDAIRTRRAIDSPCASIIIDGIGCYWCSNAVKIASTKLMRVEQVLLRHLMLQGYR
jgi:hypothetical protein